jgi:hypothetical protein
MGNVGVFLISDCSQVLSLHRSEWTSISSVKRGKGDPKAPLPYYPGYFFSILISFSFFCGTGI